MATKRQFSNDKLDAYFTTACKKLATCDSTIFLFRSILAGIFISLGCIFMIFIRSDDSIPPIITSLLSGLVFSIGLFSVVNIPSELFTGNCLLYILPNYVKIYYTYPKSKELIKNTKNRIIIFLSLNYVYNWVGISIMTLIFKLLNCNIDVATTLATAKFTKGYFELFISGCMCNILVCLAIWINRSSKSLIDSFIAVAIPVTMFVVCGFEHSIADMFFIMFSNEAGIHFLEIFLKLLIISLGNLCGGTIIANLIFYSEINYLNNRG